MKPLPKACARRHVGHMHGLTAGGAVSFDPDVRRRSGISPNLDHHVRRHLDVSVISGHRSATCIADRILAFAGIVGVPIEIVVFPLRRIVRNAGRMRRRRILRDRVKPAVVDHVVMVSRVEGHLVHRRLDHMHVDRPIVFAGVEGAVVVDVEPVGNREIPRRVGHAQILVGPRVLIAARGVEDRYQPVIPLKRQVDELPNSRCSKSQRLE